MLRAATAPLQKYSQAPDSILKMTCEEWHNVPRIIYEGVSVLVGEVDRMKKDTKVFRHSNGQNLDVMRATVDQNQRDTLRSANESENRMDGRIKAQGSQIVSQRDETKKNFAKVGDKIKGLGHRVNDLETNLKRAENNMHNMVVHRDAYEDLTA